MSPVGKRAALRSLERVRNLLGQASEWRQSKGGGDVPGSIEMGVLIGLQDAATEVTGEMIRLRKLKTSKPKVSR